MVYWAPVPRAYTLTRLSLAGDLVGLAGAGGGQEVRITPYVAGETVRATGAAAFDRRADAGGDAKIGLTNGLTLDLTVNPDFAQSEADEQQVNLTQFSQYFPEKRDFFLENAGTFYLGDTPRNNRTGTTPSVDEDLLLFFSRRMGLSSDGRRIGIDIPRAQAIKWLTANPAWSLGIDSIVGTLEPGKMADVVLWSGDPFSVYTHTLQVYNDGWLAYDRNDPTKQPITDFGVGQVAR